MASGIYERPFMTSDVTQLVIVFLVKSNFYPHEKVHRRPILGPGSGEGREMKKA
jgi:hypothetical protein